MKDSLVEPTHAFSRLRVRCYTPELISVGPTASRVYSA